MVLAKLKKVAQTFPRRAGVYLMKDRRGRLLYVGKASNLRSRVGSYFSKEADARYQIRFLMSKVDSIETVVTDNEKEALLLENTLIKKHRPRYNVDLKDDKSYVSLKFSIQDPAPRLYVTRRIRKDGSLYFGPYTSAAACREMVDFIQTYFRLRTCTDHDYRNRVRPCLQYQIKRCDAPCVGLVSLEEYGKMVQQVRLFLEGKSQELRKIANAEMKRAASQEQFEEAARFRDLMGAIDKTLEKQKVFSHHRLNRDVVGLAREGQAVQVTLMRVREGILQGQEQFFLKSFEEDGELLTSFLSQLYEDSNPIPAEILLPAELESQELLEEILRERAGRKIQLLFPKRGEKAELLQLTQQNAEQALSLKLQKDKALKATLERLQQGLHLQSIPERIECYDISHFQGGESVGSMVTFLHGKPEKKYYRQFKIKSVSGPDDFTALYEMLSRRFKRLASRPEGDGEEAWEMPDLLVIDGGKGQLNAAMQALEDLQVSKVDVIALAKSRLQAATSFEARNLEQRERSEERVFLPGRKNPVKFAPNAAELFLLMQARDEAHRFGIEFHRQWRQNRTLESALDRIPGVGKIRRQKLFQKFGSLPGIKKASVDAVAKTLGCSPQLAQKIHESI